MTYEELKQKIYGEKDIKILKIWAQLITKLQSVEQFEKEIGLK